MHKAHFLITDVQGSVVSDKLPLDVSETRATIDLTHYDAAPYFISLIVDGQTSDTKMLVKQ